MEAAGRREPSAEFLTIRHRFLYLVGNDENAKMPAVQRSSKLVRGLWDDRIGVTGSGAGKRKGSKMVAIGSMDGIMATLVIKNFPAELHARLKEQAATPAPIRLKDGYRPSVEEVEAAIAEGPPNTSLRDLSPKISNFAGPRRC